MALGRRYDNDFGSMNIIKFFIDGVSQTVTDGTGASSAISNPHPLGGGQGPVYIGKIWNSNYPFTGYLSNFRISSVARYTANFTSPTSAFTSDSNTSFNFPGPGIKKSVALY